MVGLLGLRNFKWSFFYLKKPAESLQKIFWFYLGNQIGRTTFVNQHFWLTRFQSRHQQTLTLTSPWPSHRPLYCEIWEEQKRKFTFCLLFLGSIWSTRSIWYSLCLDWFQRRLRGGKNCREYCQRHVRCRKVQCSNTQRGWRA